MVLEWDTLNQYYIGIQINCNDNAWYMTVGKMSEGEQAY